MSLNKIHKIERLQKFEKLGDGVYLMLVNSYLQPKDSDDHLMILIKQGNSFVASHFINGLIKTEENIAINNKDSYWILDITDLFDDNYLLIYMAYLKKIPDTIKKEVAVGYLFMTGYFEFSGTWQSIDFKHPTFSCVGYIACVMFGLHAITIKTDIYVPVEELEREICNEIYVLSKTYWAARNATIDEIIETENGISKKFGRIDQRINPSNKLRIRPKEFVLAVAMCLSGPNGS